MIGRTATRLALGLALGALGVAVVDLARPLPEAWFAPAESRRVLDRDGVLLAERALPDRGRQTWVPLEDIAPVVIDALIASEDHRFGAHPGVDPIAVGRALWHDLRAGRVVEGGSGLHQQTARLLAGRPPGLPGKALEAWRALKLGAHLADGEVLEWYLNRAYFGQGAWGIEQAARRTFDESPASLSASEAATLVGLLPAPERLHPRLDHGAALRARDRVLAAMVRYGRLSPEAADAARAEPLELRSPPLPGLAPHLVARVLAEHPDRAELRTTIDARLQHEVERAVAHQLDQLRGREVDHAAVLVAHLPSGEIRAYVGSAGFDLPAGQVDGVRAPRSPGSALKPFVYALAFEGGARPSDVLFDVETRFSTTHGTWRPENYGGGWSGPVSARRALASSLNLPAVRLLDQVGVPALQARLAEMGLEGVERPATQVGLGLALGDAEVTVEELATAYAALAGGGELRPLVHLAGEPRGEVRRVLDPAAAALVVDVLADPNARELGFGRHGPLERGYAAAVKTGTSTDWRDNWTAGFTREWLVVVWVGNFDHRPMVDVSGVTGAAPIWAAVLDEVTGGEGEPFPDPPGQERRTACALSGGAPGPSCPRTVDDWAPVGAPDRPRCAWHAECGVRWPAELAGWAAAAGLEAGSGCAPGGGAIAFPRQGSVLWVDPRLPRDTTRVPLRASAPTGTATAEWRVGGEVVGRVSPEQPLLWQPAGPGRYHVELLLDGAASGAVDVEVRGAR